MPEEQPTSTEDLKFISSRILLTRCVGEHYCHACGKIININRELRDKVTMDEYQISGMCEKCQGRYLKPAKAKGR